MLIEDKRLIGLFLRIIYHVSVPECQQNLKHLEVYPIHQYHYEYHERTIKRIFHLIAGNMLLMFVLDLTLFPVLCEKFVNHFFIENHEISAAKIVLYSALFLVNSFTYYSSFYLTMKYGIYAGTSAVFFLLLLKDLFKSLIIKLKLNTIDLLTLRREYIQTILLFFRVNKQFGNSLACLIVTFTPPHAYLIIHIISDANSRNLPSFAALITCSIYIFAVHFVFTEVGTIIGKPVNVLHNKYVNYFLVLKRNYPSNLYAKLTIANLIGDLNSGYCFTYSSLGKISFTAFSRFLFIYFKIMVLSNKLLNK